jgi:signal transduction histidine kinase
LHDWLATTSHDARTLLSSIQVSCQLLKERRLCSESAELLTTISASANVLLTIVQHVALLKRLDAGECDLTPAGVPMRELLADVLATARVGLAQQTGANIEHDDQEGARLPALLMVSEVEAARDASHVRAAADNRPHAFTRMRRRRSRRSC